MRPEIEYYYDSSVITCNMSEIKFAVLEIVSKIISQELSDDIIFESNVGTHSTIEQTNPGKKIISVEIGKSKIGGNNISVRFCKESYQYEQGDSRNRKSSRKYYLAKISKENKS